VGEERIQLRVHVTGAHRRGQRAMLGGEASTGPGARSCPGRWPPTEPASRRPSTRAGAPGVGGCPVRVGCSRCAILRVRFICPDRVTTRCTRQRPGRATRSSGPGRRAPAITLHSRGPRTSGGATGRTETRRGVGCVTLPQGKNGISTATHLYGHACCAADSADGPGLRR
jgi:hypothetical protein